MSFKAFIQIASVIVAVACIALIGYFALSYKNMADYMAEANLALNAEDYNRAAEILEAVLTLRNAGRPSAAERWGQLLELAARGAPARISSDSAGRLRLRACSGWEGSWEGSAGGPPGIPGWA